MCITFFKIGGPTDALPFTIAFNRDEVLHRASAPAKFLSEYPHIICGIDI